MSFYSTELVYCTINYYMYELKKNVLKFQARILYSDQQGRVAIATAFNKAVAAGEIKVHSIYTKSQYNLHCTVFSANVARCLIRVCEQPIS